MERRRLEREGGIGECVFGGGGGGGREGEGAGEGVGEGERGLLVSPRREVRGHKFATGLL